MFKIGKNKEKGFFFAYGKHNCYGDFLKIGLENPIASAFAKWVENGVTDTGMAEERGINLRFWAEGPNGELVCGILCSSEDSCGRGFPLITSWTGIPGSWKKFWQITPLMCSTSWQAIESVIGSKKLKPEDFRDRLNNAAFPESSWKKESAGSKSKKIILNPELLNKLNNIDGLLRNRIFRVDTGCVSEEDLVFISIRLNELLRKRATVPKAVFTGGDQSGKYIIFVNRQLSINDFKYIWSGIPEEKNQWI